GEPPQMELGQKVPDILAAANRVQCRAAAGAIFAQPLPHPLTCSVDDIIFRLLGAQSSHCLIQSCLGILFLMLHRLPLANFVKSFFNRARVRCSTTATTAGEVCIMPAISRLL